MGKGKLCFLKAMNDKYGSKDRGELEAKERDKSGVVEKDKLNGQG